MNSTSSERLIGEQGILGELFPRVFREQLPGLFEVYRNQRIWMMVTTRIDHLDEESRRSSCYFRPPRYNQPPEFTWKGVGVFHAVIRQFRLDFLRHLGRRELESVISMLVYLGDSAPDMLRENIVSQVAEGSSGSSAIPEPRGSESARVIDATQLQPDAASAGDRNNADKSNRWKIQPDHEDDSARARAKTADRAVYEADTHHDLDEQSPHRRTGDKRPVNKEKIESDRSEWKIAPDSGTESGAGKSRPAGPAARLREPLVGSSPRALPGNLYQEFFGLERMPFNNTPDTYFYFPTEKHQEALSRLLYAISEKKGFVMISGEIGSGKSTLCRTLLSQLSSNVKVALITHTHLEAAQVVIAIAEDLGINVEGLNRYQAQQALNNYLIDQLARNCTVCIIIDEAQNLSPDALEEVRMISNLETEQEKLVQLILLGQPELRDKLRLASMKQLKQRISVQYHLEPLTRDETVGYIQHRLKTANPTEGLVFQRGAMVEAYRYSGGIPRLINTLCDNALLTAFSRQKSVITAAMIIEAANDMDLVPQGGGLAQFFKSW
jgi:type II secretory pathway predicted ATPase ExeA